MQELVNGQRSKKYLKDGMEHTGGSRKMPDGSVHSRARHTKTSRPVVSFKDLSEREKKKARPFK
mgnify:CR=1 FL=1